MKGPSLTQLDLIFIKINHQLLAAAVRQALLAPGKRFLLPDIEEVGGGGGGGEHRLQPLPHHLRWDCWQRIWKHHHHLLSAAQAGPPILPGGARVAQKFFPLSSATGNLNWFHIFATLWLPPTCLSTPWNKHLRDCGCNHPWKQRTEVKLRMTVTHLMRSSMVALEQVAPKQISVQPG